MNAKFFNIFTMKKSIDFFIFLSNFLISSLLTKTFVFYLFM
ncbi:hypothetical protein RUMOBE_01554 [Blautia obeum ATCC 29174]|uniref:Uncharacterized protein n=1 Tax=Blautia obeum ATCC 29174 TaxID=411459 RepID=A5ZRC6_9FIRM|nr:hypothetical protein RUMOBE_01554 [Blautia obeum ATCC 29174]